METIGKVFFENRWVTVVSCEDHECKKETRFAPRSHGWYTFLFEGKYAGFCGIDWGDENAEEIEDGQ